MAVNPAYVDVAVKRWQAFTGEKAILEGDGRTFDAVAGERTVGVAAERESPGQPAGPASSLSPDPAGAVAPAGDGR